ncbi:MAG: sugar-binding transcriptional regulator [Anaerolineae bacterium]|nr:sugar-binding transcriptional regulator [Anaerolineae bacterium]
MLKIGFVVNEDIRLLTKVATLYYQDHCSQQEVASRLGLSRQTVGRHLRRASELGIVRIEICSDLAYVSELEMELERLFDLLEVIVVSPAAETDDAIKAAIGVAMAEFLERRVKDGDTVGFGSGSSTVYQGALHLSRAYMPDVTVVSLTGSAPRAPMPWHSVVYVVGKAWHARTIMLPAPAFVDRPEIKKALLSDSNIAAVFDLAAAANIVVYGIGVVSETASPYQQGLVEHDMVPLLSAMGGVGEIIGHTFNLQGEVCSPEMSARTIAVDLDKLRTKELSIAAAGGHWKVDAIYGALAGRFCNVLITDEDTARALIKRAQTPKNGAGPGV